MSARPEDAWWMEYPLNLPTYDPSRLDGDGIRTQLEKAECFQTDEDEDLTSLRVLDIFREQDGGKLEPTLCKSTIESEAVLLRPAATSGATQPQPRVRIISIHSEATTGPLQISSKLMRKILAKYEVEPEFMQLLLSFQECAEVAEHSNFDFCAHTDEKGFETLTYEIRYMEPRGKTEARLVDRHTGVYHQQKPNFDLFILLQSKEYNTAEERILSLARPDATSKAELEKICDDPLRIHTFILSSYILNWRPYLGELSSRFSERSDPAMVLQPNTLEAGAINFRQVQQLRSIQDELILAVTRCRSAVDVVQGLDQRSIGGLSGLQFLKKQLGSYIDHAETLRDKVRNTIDLIGFLLDRGLQVQTAEVYGKLEQHTEQVHYLTEDTVKNNKAVAILTFLAAVYLPGSFVATLFGMNFIVVNKSQTRIAVTDDVWIYFLIWALLSVVTAGVYLLIANHQNKKSSSANSQHPGFTFNLGSMIELNVLRRRAAIIGSD